MAISRRGRRALLAAAGIAAAASVSLALSHAKPVSKLESLGYAGAEECATVSEGVGFSIGNHQSYLPLRTREVCGTEAKAAADSFKAERLDYSDSGKVCLYGTVPYKSDSIPEEDALGGVRACDSGFIDNALPPVPVEILSKFAEKNIEEIFSDPGQEKLAVTYTTEGCQNNGSVTLINEADGGRNMRYCLDIGGTLPQQVDAAAHENLHLWQWSLELSPLDAVGKFLDAILHDGDPAGGNWHYPYREVKLYPSLMVGTMEGLSIIGERAIDANVAIHGDTEFASEMRIPRDPIALDGEPSQDPHVWGQIIARRIAYDDPVLREEFYKTIESPGDWQAELKFERDLYDKMDSQYRSLLDVRTRADFAAHPIRNYIEDYLAGKEPDGFADFSRCFDDAASCKLPEKRTGVPSVLGLLMEMPLIAGGVREPSY